MNIFLTIPVDCDRTKYSIDAAKTRRTWCTEFAKSLKCCWCCLHFWTLRLLPWNCGYCFYFRFARKTAPWLLSSPSFSPPWKLIRRWCRPKKQVAAFSWIWWCQIVLKKINSLSLNYNSSWLQKLNKLTLSFNKLNIIASSRLLHESLRCDLPLFSAGAQSADSRIANRQTMIR